MSPTPRPESPNAGFTIIEVLIALALVAVGLTAIGSVFGTNARGTRTIEQHVALVETVRGIAATIPLAGELTGSELTGETSGYRWRIDVLPYDGDGLMPVDDSPWLPRIVKIRVQSPEGPIYDLETVRMQRKPKQ